MARSSLGPSPQQRARSGPLPVKPVEKVSITRLKGSLSAYLAKVKAGHSLLITDRDHGIAVLAPVTWDWRGDPMLDLVLSGQVAPPSEELEDEFFRGPTVKDPEGRLRAFLEEDRNER